MPKPKPDQIIRHEIALSRPLQESLDGYVASAQFRNIADPAVRLMNDVTGTLTFLGLLATLGLTGVVFAYKYGGQTDPVDIFNDWVAQRASALSRKIGADQKLDAVTDPLRNPTARGPLEIFFAQLFGIVDNSDDMA